MSTNMFSVLFFCCLNFNYQTLIHTHTTKQDKIYDDNNRNRGYVITFFLSHVTSDVEPTVDNLFFFDLALFFSLFFFPLIIVVIIIIIHFGLSSSCPIWTAQIEWWKFIIQTLFILGISFFLSIFFHCSLILLCRQI